MRLARGRWRSAPSLPFEPSDDAVIFGCGRDLLLLRARHGDRSIVRRGRDRPTRRPVPAHPLGLGEPSLGGRAMPRLPCPTRWLSPSRVRRRALSPLRRATHFLRLSRRGAGQLTARSWHALGCPREHSGTRAVSQLGWLYGMVLAVDPEANKRLVERFYDEVWARGNVEFTPEVFADDYVRHDLRPTPAMPGPGGQAQIARAFREA